MERTIKVTGKGKLAVKPDTVRLSLELNGINRAYDKTLKESSEGTETLRELFTKFQFDRHDLKTTYFNINSKYESYNDKNNNWKQRFKGYEYTHRMKIEFPNDNERLGQILYALAHCSIQPEFHIEYTISDPESAKSELLKRAVEDSKTKAQTLTEAAGVKLGSIINIDYSWAEMEFVSRPLDDCRMMMCETDAAENKSYNLDIEADDINVTDTVTVVWDI